MRKGSKPVVLGSNLGNADESLRRFAKEYKKVKNGVKGAGKAEIIGDARKFWTSSTEHSGIKVYQRNDLINPNFIDDVGRTNLQRMQKGIAPIGSDGKSINLHHMIQTSDSAIVELTDSFHKTNSSTIHINPNTIPSGINRNQFNSWKRSYWKNRALDFE